MTPISARAPLAAGAIAILVLVGVLGSWAVATRIAGAVVTRGVVKVENDRQVVQHPDGGVVGRILAHDGDRVAQGDVLVRLDDTFLLSELTIVEQQLVELAARKARLAAERDGANAVEMATPEGYGQLTQDWVEEQIAGQASLFEARATSLSQAEGQLSEQVSQIDRQIDGLDAQLDAMKSQLALVTAERTDLDGLLKRGLVPAGRVNELEREEARMQGEIGRLVADKAEARTRQSSLAIEVLKLHDTRREEAISELRDLGYSEIELQERRLSLTEKLARLDLRAPVAGTVFGSRVLTVGSVIRPADPAMFIVPGEQPLQITVRIDPSDVDEVFAGQPVALMFTTFNRRTTPEIGGEVLRISADAVTDQTSGARYYEAIVTPDSAQIAAVPGLTLLPGMPVEAFLRTEERSPLDYLTQPLTVYFSRAFRES